MKDERIILSIEYEDGTVGKREILSIFKAKNGREYASLLPLNNDTVKLNANVELVRVIKTQNDNLEDDYFIEAITSDAELNIAIEAFEKLELQGKNNPEEDADDELLTLRFKNGNGDLEDWKVVDLFEHSNQRYVALIPFTDSEDDYGNIKIHLMRLNLFVQGGVEGCEVSSIPTNKEYEEVANIFESRVEKVDTGSN